MKVIVWRVTQDCNMRCRFCSYSGEVERRRSDADAGEIGRLCGILGEYKRQSGEDILVSWIGGEPFLRGDLIEHSKRLNGFGIKVGATTNGLLLGSERLRRGVLESFSEIVFSIDSFRDCDDEVRQCPGHFDAVSRNIKLLDSERKSLGSPLRIKVNTILMRRNFPRFEEFCEYLGGLGVDEITFNQLGGFDRPEFYEDNRLTVEQAQRLCGDFSRIRDKFAERGLVIHGSERYLERILKTARGEKISIAGCKTGEWFWFINENGFISPCSYTSYEHKFDIREIKGTEDIARVGEFFGKCPRSRWCDDCYCTQVYDKFE